VAHIMSSVEKWPNFFIVGVAKAGTTSLYEYLNSLPEIFMSPNKEPNYFSVKSIPINYYKKPLRDEKKYLNLFKKSTTEKVIGEASPGYLIEPEAPKLIHEKNPNARILISLRDPVERLFSSYLMLRKYGWIKLSFREEIEKSINKSYDPLHPHIKIEDGLYSEPLKRYLKIFGERQVKIIIFEDWITNTKKTIEEILKFLNVNRALEDFQAEQHNPFSESRGVVAQSILRNLTIKKLTDYFIPSSTKKAIKKLILLKKQSKPQMSEDDKNFLIKFYKDDVKKLENFLGRKLPWPNFQSQ